MWIALALLCVTATAREIIELTLENYAEAKKTHRPLLVLFHNDDRQNLRFFEEFRTIADDDDVLDPAITLGVVDAAKEEKLVAKTQISKFPTAYLFLGEDEKYKYKSYWVKEYFVNWVRKQYSKSPSQNPYSPALKITDYHKLKQKFELFHVTVMLYIEENDHAMLSTYQTLAKEFKDFYFAYFHDPAIAEYFKVEKHSLYLHSTTEDRDTYVKSDDHNDYLIHYEGDLNNAEELHIFLKIHNKKRFYYLDYYKYGDLVKRKDQFMSIFFVYNSSMPGHEEYAYQLKKHKRWAFRKTYIGVLDVTKDASSRARHDFWFPYPDGIPTLVAVRSKGDGENYWKYKCPHDPWHEESIKLCHDDIINNRIPNFIRNEHFDEDKVIDYKGVRNLNSTTFWDYIADNNNQGKDVFMNIHMVGCKQCEEFRPTLDRVIDRIYANEDNKDKLLFAQIDWQMNELENTGVDKFPYLRLYPAYNKGHINAVDLKTERSLVHFLKKNCHNHLDGIDEDDL